MTTTTSPAALVRRLAVTRKGGQTDLAIVPGRCSLVAGVFQDGQDRRERLPEQCGLRAVQLVEDQPPDGCHVPGGC